MKLNASKTKTMIVPRSRTMHRQSPSLANGGTVLKESDDLVILGVTFISRAASTISRAASRSKTWYLEKDLAVFRDRSLLGRCFRGPVLPVLEYCSAVWCSATNTHLKLLDRAVSGAQFLTGGVFECDIADRRSVAVLCMLYKIRCNTMHPLDGALPEPYHGVLHGYTRRPGHTSVYLCAASLQNLAALQDFYSPLSVPLE